MRLGGLLTGLALCLLLPSCASNGSASSTAPATANDAARVHLVRVGNFSSPVYVTAPKGDNSRVFVVERAGRIMLVKNGKQLSAPFLDIRGDVSSGGERGLLSMAFAPDYAQSGNFYIYYTDHGGNIRVQELGRSSNPDRADPSTRRQVLFQDHSSFPNHNGGQLQFGPDGDLYIGVGDGGSEGDPLGHGQSLSTLLAKILRIDPNASGGRAYSIPNGNPFVSQRGARSEIYSYGLRNPWRFSFDRVTGDLTIGDVGQDKFEEIDFEPKGQAAGANFGWKGYEGFHRYSSVQVSGNYEKPVLVRSHKSGFCAIVGGYVVRDRSLPGLYGRYLYGDNCDSGIYSAKLSAGHATGGRTLSVRVKGLSSFGEDARGRIYLASLAGPVYRLAA
jgi:glucose/arabinose dehydrogenase